LEAARPPSQTVQPPPQRTVLAGADDGTANVQLKELIPLGGVMLIGREAQRVQIHLAHVHVSRIHAQITLQGNRAVISDLRSANGTFVNGRRSTGPMTIKAGDRIDIGPYSLVFTGTGLLPQSRENNIELVCRGLRRVVQDRTTGQPLTLLDDINLVIRPREFVCLLGPSGSGKSTLLSALSARVPATEGAVLVNHKELYANFESLKQDMVVVAQKDILHELLPVGKALWYTARLRLPPDTSRAEVQDCIAEMLQTVNLTKQHGTQIRHLSGGQIKRVSLANEILCKPTLLFLDEVTSGLDEQTDHEMMTLFRQLADAGKTVVCITHSLANVERNCHLVVILTAGGKLAFVGTPAEALTYFGIDRLGDVYQRLGEEPAEQWQAAFLASPLYDQYVTARQPAPESIAQEPSYTPPRSLAHRCRTFTRQLALLSRRYLAILLGDRPALFMTLGQVSAVVILLITVFGDLTQIESPFEHAQRTFSLFFLMEIACLWFGCNNAAKEIVKERPIYRRERDFNLQVGSYYASKLVLLSLLSILQATLLAVPIRVFCQPPGDFFEQWAFLATTAVVGVALGLLISAVSRTQDLAITLIPIALLPQIILTGVVAPLQGVGKFLAEAFVTSYWSNRGLRALVPENIARMAGVEQASASQAFLVLAGHGCVFAIAAVAVLLRQDQRERRQ
jgi:ABC-type multidrug transport system ATPase subunit